MKKSLAFGAMALVTASFFPAEAEDFYKGKVVTIVTSTGAGGGYDTMARLFARHMGRHITGGPYFIVRNMPGGGNVTATNFLYNIAPKDGLTIGSIHNAMPLNEVLGGTGVAYESDKFYWLGSTGPDNSVIVVKVESGLTSLDQAMKTEVTIGSTGAGSGLTIIPLAINRILGTQFKIVIGYRSSDEINLALERDEVQGRTFGYSSIVSQKPDWLRDKKMNYLLQIGAKRHPDLPDVKLVTEFAKNDEDRLVLQLISSPPGLGQPYIAPPGTPLERLAILRKAFADTMKDGAYLKESKALNMDVDPMSAEEVAAIVRAVIQAPPEIAAKAKAAVAPMR